MKKFMFSYVNEDQQNNRNPANYLLLITQFDFDKKEQKNKTQKLRKNICPIQYNRSIE